MSSTSMTNCNTMHRYRQRRGRRPSSIPVPTGPWSRCPWRARSIVPTATMSFPASSPCLPGFRVRSRSRIHR
ncbi:hypothetical protein [Lysobacter gummosus]|uniref:hypothetical protein n=1 Tax=Lysobacter gummosus TaxID=262324 RepID=UPI00363F9F96